MSQVVKQLDLWWEHDICIFKDGETEKQEIPLGNGITTWINQGYYNENEWIFSFVTSGKVGVTFNQISLKGGKRKRKKPSEERGTYLWMNLLHHL